MNSLAKILLAMSMVTVVIAMIVVDAAAEPQFIKVIKRSLKSNPPKTGYGCACARIIWPVCGSDGVSYSNECTFNCAARTRSGLKIVKKSACDDDEYDELEPFLP